MYTIDKLQKLNDYLDNDSNESVLARYLLNNLKHINTISLQKCIRETGVSKSSIHRFFNTGGFDSFKELIETLAKEMEEEYKIDKNYFDNKHFLLDNNHDISSIESLCKFIKQAQKIYFYGKQNEIDKLRYVIKYIRSTGKQYSYLNTWNINKIYDRLLQLQENDLLIIVDTSLRIQDLYELSINYRNLIPIHEIYRLDFKKVFIGDISKKTFGKFMNIKIERNDIIGLDKLDYFIYKYLLKGEK